MEINLALTKLGLSQTEAIIYTTLLKIKEVSAVQLAKETQVHRRTIYDNLNILLRKGLVSFTIKNGVKYFRATNPSSLKIFLEEKVTMLDSIFPSLQQWYENDLSSPKINIFVGTQGAKALVEEIIGYRGMSYWVGGGGAFFRSLRYSRGFIKKKFAKMKLKTLQPDLPATKELLEIVSSDNIRILSKEFASEVGYLVYGNTVAIGCVQDDEITIIKIESAAFSKAFKNYFEMMWMVGNKINEN